MARAINEGGQVVGFRHNRSPGNCGVGCTILWDNGSTIDLWPGGQGERGREAINDRGQVVGYGNYQSSGWGYGYWDALLWENGPLINLGLQEGRWLNNPNLLNNRGQIMLGSGGRLYLWHDSTLIPFASPQESGVYASAINDSGAVAGYSSTDVYGGHALLWQIVTAAE